MNQKSIKTCVVCSTPLTGTQRKFCSTKCDSTEGNLKHQSYEKQQLRSKSRKLDIIISKGGKCEVCGYSKNYAALCFHHKDPSKKEMKLDSRKLSNSSMDSILREAEKCQLLCHNCHMEIHHPQCLL